MNIIVTGTLGFDFIMDFPGRFADRIMPDKIHKISLGFLVDSLSKQFGGVAGNIGYGLKLLGINPIILSAAGNDFEPYQKFLKKIGIDSSTIAIHKDLSTGHYFVVTDQDDNQIGSFFKGATKYADQLSIKKTQEKNPSRLAMICPTDPEAMIKYVKECQEINLEYLYDPAFQIDHFTREELLGGISKAEILIGNDYEVSLIEKKLQMDHAQLLSLCKILITTLGAEGSLIETKNEEIRIGAAKIDKAVDPTGAGDAYRAGFMAGYVREFPLLVCGQMGSVAAAYAVENYGTMTYSFTPEEFQKRYRDNFGEEIKI